MAIKWNCCMGTWEVHPKKVSDVVRVDAPYDAYCEDNECDSTSSRAIINIWYWSFF